MKPIFRALALAVAAAGGLVAVGPALAETIVLTSLLTGAESVPPNDSAATGMVEASFDTASHQLSWTVSYEGLSGQVIGAHFHGPAAPGGNAGIVVPFTVPDSGPIIGMTLLTDQQAADLLAGLFYANLHTARHPGGEIRGQLTRSDTPAL
jgi:hypothetical protein